MATGMNNLNDLSQTSAKTSTVQGNELASQQLEGLLRKDSPLRHRAEASGKNYATSRGLLNSNMGAEATFGAFVDRATPIAMADAGRYGQVADANLAHENQFRLSDKAFGQQGLLQRDDQQWRSGENAMDREHAVGMQGRDHSHASSMQGSQQSFTSSENALGRDLAREELASREQMAAADLASRERIAADEAQRTMERMEFDARLAEYNLNNATKSNILSQISGRMVDVYLDGDLTPAATEAAIQNLMKNAEQMAEMVSKTVGGGTGGSNVPQAPFNSEKATNIMIDEVGRLGRPQPTTEEIQLALEYVKAHNLTEQAMRAYVRDVYEGRKPLGLQ